MYCLRCISEHDSLSLAKMHDACFSDVWSSDYFRSFIANMQCFGFIISAAQLEREHEEWIDCGFVLWHRVFPEEAELLKICVLPNRRRKGIGKTLLEESKKYASNNTIKKFLLEVAMNNFPAICLYECVGFKKITQRKGYYKINEKLIDANIMALNLE